MTVKEYNQDFHTAFNKALSFVSCLNHALDKSGEEAKRQVAIVGWDEETQQIIQNALYVYNNEVKKNLQNNV